MHEEETIVCNVTAHVENCTVVFPSGYPPDTTFRIMVVAIFENGTEIIQDTQRVILTELECAGM